MRIAITGGSGFIGLACAEALTARRHEVTLLDLAPPPPEFVGHPALGSARYLRVDVCDAQSLAQSLEQLQPDGIVHLAALTPNEHMERNCAAAIVAVNVTGTATVLDAARKVGCRRIVVLSSVAVYGSSGADFGELDAVNETTPLRPNSLYGITKRAGEDVALRFGDLTDLDVTILRLGPVFGPWERHGAARPDLSPHAEILRQAAPRLANDMRADWLYSRDAGEAIALVVEHEGLGGRTFNLGAGAQSTPGEWAFAAGLPIPAIAPEKPTVACRIPQRRPPLSITCLQAAIPYAGTRPTQAAAADHMAWLDSLGLAAKRAFR